MNDLTCHTLLLVLNTLTFIVFSSVQEILFLFSAFSLKDMTLTHVCFL